MQEARAMGIRGQQIVKEILDRSVRGSDFLRWPRELGLTHRGQWHPKKCASYESTEPDSSAFDLRGLNCAGGKGPC